MLQHLGKLLAQIHIALKDVDHPAMKRTFEWDVARADQHRKKIQLFNDASLKGALQHAMHLHAALDLADCPRGLLHGDFNDENILVEGKFITGVVDFTDAHEGAYVQDLAIFLAYAVQHQDMMLDDLATAVAAYDKRRPLTLAEQEALFPLMLARLATTICVAEARAQVNRDHETWFSHAGTARDALLKFQSVSPRHAQSVLCKGCMVQPPPAIDTAKLLDERRARLGSMLSLSYQKPLHITHGRGQYLYSCDGQPYLDLVNNVLHVGHCHPHVVRAIATQASVLNTNTRYLSEGLTEFARRLTDTMPEPLDTCFLVNSGSEANDVALRIAREVTGHYDAVVIDGGYHGVTSTCVNISPYKFNGRGGRGCVDWVHTTPCPDIYRGKFRGVDAAAKYALEAGRTVTEAMASGRSIAAFFVEPILSCAGQIELPQGYLRSVFQHVHAAGGLTVADEVQVGLGRVGDAMWGFELHNVVPDIVTVGKPLGNGHPVSAVVTTRAIADSFSTGMEFFSTFGGNHVSCAAGIAVLDVIANEGLQARAKKLGEYFLVGLKGLQSRHDLIGDVRGRGLFLGVELVRNRRSLEPAAEEAAEIVNAMKDRGVLLSTDGPLYNVIKIKPPLVLTKPDIDMALFYLDELLARYSRSV